MLCKIGMGISIKWDITYKCNLYCEHCINAKMLGDIKDELKIEQIQNVIRNLKNNNVSYVHMLGGEPTTRNDFAQIMKFLSDEKIFFGFNTNGISVERRDIKDEIIKNSYVKNIVFSLESPDKEINDKIRGKKVFERIVSAIKNYTLIKKELSKSDLKLTVNMVVGKLNKKQVVEMLFFCIELGIDELVLLQLIPEGNAKDKNLSLSFEEEKEVVENIADIYGEIKDKIIIVPRFTRPIAQDYCQLVLGKDFPNSVHGCGAGTIFACVDNKGWLYPCDRIKEQMSKIYSAFDLSLVHKDFSEIFAIEEFGNIYQKSESIEFYKNIEPCNSCVYLREECFPCSIEIERNGIQKINNCSNYINLIRKKFVSENIFTKEIFDNYHKTKLVRVTYPDLNTVRLFNIANFSMIDLDHDSYNFFNRFSSNNHEEFIPNVSMDEYRNLFEILIAKQFLLKK